MSVEIVTFGCRLNAFESEVIRREADRAGLSDTIVINTCAVTNEAVAQARQSIRRLKRERPDVRIVVTGCAAQTQTQMFADMAEVDRVIGNDEKMRAEAWRETQAFLARDAFGLGTEEKIAVNDIMAIKETAAHLIDGLDGRARAFVQVQNGCDHRCTFCIIPYGRGNSRSVPMGEVVAQVRKLAANVSGSVCAAQPVTRIRASGRSRRSRRIAWRAWRTASAVTAQVLTTTTSAGPAPAASSPAPSALRRITSDS